MKIYLRDRNEHLVEEWRKVFKDKTEVEISHGNIFDEGTHLDAQAIVSPANSFGFMDGGIDAVYSNYFGWEIGTKLREDIQDFFKGELLVGNCAVIRLLNNKYGNYYSIRNKNCFLISAPTMRVPLNVANTPNAYLAFKSSLLFSKEKLWDSLLCPGLCTATGGMSPEVCAHQMYCAYIDYNNPRQFRSLRDAAIFNNFLINPDLYNKS